MKRIFALMLVMMSVVGTGRSQSVVSEVPSIYSDTTIVRQWKQNIAVMYACRKSDKSKFFVLVDDAAPTIRRIAVPVDVTVNDFRILHDTLFVGGHYMLGTTPIGLLACFDLNDFYAAGGNFHWAVAQPTLMPDIAGVSCYNQVTDIVRLALYDSAGFSKIAYIARNYIVGETTQRVGMGYARFDGTLWNGWIIYNKYAVEEYTDIIATQNYVVAASRTNDSARLALRIFPKSSYLFPTWTWYPFYVDKNGQGYADLEVDENVMATALDGDKFALAYHYHSGPVEGIALRTFSIAGGWASLTQAVNAPVTPLPGSTWKMRDIRYSATRGMIAVLNDIDGSIAGGQESIVYQFPGSMLVSGSYAGSYFPGYGLHAMDPFGTNGDAVALSGNPSGGGLLSLYWAPLSMLSGCGVPETIQCIKTTATPYKTFMETNMNNTGFYDGSSPFVVEEKERNVICEQ